MLLSIIIVNYRTGPLTRVLIKSLLPQVGENMEIIVVDNNSRDESVGFLRSDFPDIRVVENEMNVGFAGGVNAGIRAATGKYYLILNPDMVALPGALKTLVKFMETHPEVGMAGGKLVSPAGKLQYSCFRFYRPMTILYRRTMLGKTPSGKQELVRFEMHDYERLTIREVDWLQGSCMMVRRAAVDEVGLMDEERFFMYFEDVDWCRRLWQAGWKVMFVPEAEFSHFHQRSSETGSLKAVLTNKLTREHIKSAIKYFWKYRAKELPH